MPKSWREKLDGGKPAHVEVMTKAFGGGQPGDRMLIATPRVVDDFMRRQPAGTAMTLAEMRSALAKERGAELCCPISTSIFARIAAEVAIEELAADVPVETVTPFWRVVEPESALAGKLSCGVGFVSEFRAREAG